MKICRHLNARSFLDRTEHWLLNSEAEYNVILSVAHLLLTHDHPFQEPIYLASVEQDRLVVGCAVLPPPDGLTLTTLPRAAVSLLVNDLAEYCDDLPDVAGPQREVTEFGKRWAKKRAVQASEPHRSRWYALEKVVDPVSPAKGELRLATLADLDLVQSWASSYARDVGASVDVHAYFERRIRTNSLYLWDDEGPRALVAVSGLTPTAARVSGVYTPPEFRRRGYATATVAAVSRAVLETGRRMCVLFADQTDPTPNSIYQRIGYRPICETVGIQFS